MDEGDVDPIQAEALQALLERAADAVGAVVEDHSHRFMANVEGVLAIIQPLPIDIRVERDLRLRPDYPPIDAPPNDRRVTSNPVRPSAMRSIGSTAMPHPNPRAAPEVDAEVERSVSSSPRSTGQNAEQPLEPTCD
jgi:hypothetical protein